MCVDVYAHVRVCVWWGYAYSPADKKTADTWTQPNLYELQQTDLPVVWERSWGLMGVRDVKCCTLLARVLWNLLDSGV